MVNFIIKNSQSFQLNSVIKQYKVDQDKYIHPKATFINASRALKKAFPEKKLNLNEIKVTDDISVFDFGNKSINSHGKGATKDQAKASAIMEFAERFSWLNFDYKNASGYTNISFNNFKKTKDINNIEKCFCIAYSNKKEELCELIKDIPLHWVGAYSLTRNQPTFYPANWNTNYQTCNGLASGNSKEEAILQAICEVIERHNSSNFILNSDKFPTELIDTKSLDDEVANNLIKSLKKHGIDIYLINATQDLDVSTIIAHGIDHNSPLEARAGYGYGCHTDPQKAVIRAITEYVQCRENLIKKLKTSQELKLKKGQWESQLNINIDKILNKSKIISYNNLPNISNNDFKIEIQTIVEILAKYGFEIIIIDKTHPLLNIPVYRVFVPGLLPGTTIVSLNENDDMLITVTYYQGGQIEAARKYYKEHFKNIMNNFDFGLQLIEQRFPQFNLEKIKDFITPDHYVLESFCKSDYLEQVKAVYKMMAGNIDPNNYKDS